MQIIITGQTDDGQTVAQEKTDSTRTAAMVAEQWRGSGLTVTVDEK